MDHVDVSASATENMFVSAAAGEVLSFMGMDLVWKITSAMSRGAYVAFVQIGPPGTGVPMHIHHRDEENAFIIDGELVFQVADEKFKARKGDILNLPRGTPHGFRITGDASARILFTVDLSPDSDYEAMFAGLVGLVPSDFDRIKAVCGANNVEFLIPPQMP